MTFGYIAAGIAIAGTAVSVDQSRQSRKASERANKAQRNIDAIKNQREKLKQIREKRISTAQILQAGATQGVGDSSSVRGGVSSVGASSNANLAFINQIEGLQQNIQRNMESAGKHAGNAQAAGAIASIAGSFTGGPTNTSSGLPDQFSGQNTGIAGSSNFVGPSRG